MGKEGAPAPPPPFITPSPSPSRSHPTPSIRARNRCPAPHQGGCRGLLSPSERVAAALTPPRPTRLSSFLPPRAGGGGGAKGVAVVVVALAGGGLFLPGRARRRGREGAPRASSPPGACLPARARSPTLHTRRSLRPLRRRPMRSSRQPASQPADQPWTAPQARSRPPARPPAFFPSRASPRLSDAGAHLPQSPAATPSRRGLRARRPTDGGPSPQSGSGAHSSTLTTRAAAAAAATAATAREKQATPSAAPRGPATPLRSRLPRPLPAARPPSCLLSSLRSLRSGRA